MSDNVQQPTFTHSTWRSLWRKP